MRLPHPSHRPSNSRAYLAVGVVLIGMVAVIAREGVAAVKFSKPTLGFCFGSPDVEEWNKVVTRLKANNYKEDEEMCGWLDRLTNSMAGKTKRTLAIMLSDMEQRSMTKLSQLASKAQELEHQAMLSGKKIDGKIESAKDEAYKTAAQIQSEIDVYDERRKIYDETVSKREETEKTERQQFEEKLQEYRNQIEDLKKAIEAEKEKHKSMADATES
ncbi:hypothetical protein AAMO2058_001139300 [Amorphochlora amoebiformis]